MNINEMDDQRIRQYVEGRLAGINLQITTNVAIDTTEIEEMDTDDIDHYLMNSEAMDDGRNAAYEYIEGGYDHNKALPINPYLQKEQRGLWIEHFMEVIDECDGLPDEVCPDCGNDEWLQAAWLNNRTGEVENIDRHEVMCCGIIELCFLNT